MNAKPQPPNSARRLLALALPSPDRDWIAGDLLEMYRKEHARRGSARAWLWYWGQAISFSMNFLVERVREGKAWSLDAARPAAGVQPLGAARTPGSIHPTWTGIETGTNRRQGMRQTLEGWARDVTHAARALARAPAFTVITVATLALAIGANTAIFSVINTVLLDPLQYDEPDRLVSILSSAPGSDLPEEFGPGTEFYVQYRENASALEDLALYQAVQTTVQSDDQVERLFISAVSPTLYSTLRVTPVLGRLPTDQDAEGTVVVLSHWLWTDWFGNDPSVLGRTLEISGGTRTVIGVMGPDFRFPLERISLWVHDLPTEPITPGGFGLGLVGRLAPGADHATLTAQLNELASRLPERFGGPPAYQRIIEQHRAIVRSLEEELVGDVAGPLWLLLGVVGIILLIACANVANLLFVRAESRRRDLAVRRALGAGRLGLVRSQLSEALVLAGLGGLGGVLLAWLGVPVLVRSAPESIPGLARVGLNGVALLFTGAVTIVAALAAGLLPALRFSNPGFMGLRESGRVGTGPNHLTRDALVVVQTAAALVLLVASGLLVQSFRQLSSVDPGFDTEDIFTFQLAPDPREHGLADGPSVARFHYGFLDRLAALPGVQSVGLVNTLPLDEGAGLARVTTEAIAGAQAIEPLVRVTYAGGDYFQTMGIELLQGSYLERKDQADGVVEVIISEMASELLWPGEDPLGKRVRPAGQTEIWLTVRGVVEDVFLEDFAQESAEPMIYLPMIGPEPTTWAVGTPAYVVKTERAGSIAPEIRDLIHEIAPSAPMYRVFTMDGLASRSMAQLSFTMMTLVIAAGLALVLGAVGLYGVLSYVVSRRTREIGIRMALGAHTGELRRMVVRQGLVVALVGVVIGVIVALALARVLEARFLEPLLFDVMPFDPLTFAAMSGLMLGVALIASYIPALRASSVDPMRSLRAE